MSNYYWHLDNIVILRDNIFTERAERRAEGRAEGHAKGFDEANRKNARSMKAKGIPAEVIAEITGLSIDKINQLN